MSGGLSSLRTAVVTLGCGLVLFGSALLLRGTFAPAPLHGIPLLAADGTASRRVNASAISLGPLEADDFASGSPSRSAAQLLAQIEDNDMPPPPAVTEPEKPTPQPAPPAVELLDVQPEQTVSKPALTMDFLWQERQEEQLARIAYGIEWLSRQSQLSFPDRITVETTPTHAEVFSAPPERETTALIKIERTAEDRDRFSLEVRTAPVADVLSVLSELAGLKLELAGGVSGRTTLTLREVTLGEAINSVLQQTNLGVERDEHLLRVMPRQMAEERALHREPMITRRYTPRTMRSVELLPLVRPLLTPRFGRMTVIPDRTSPLCPEPGKALPSDVLVIVDRAAVHAAVTKLLQELEPLTPQPMPKAHNSMRENTWLLEQKSE